MIGLKKYFIFCFLLSVFVFAISFVSIKKVSAANEMPDLGYPFPKGETWYVVEGYKAAGGSHYDGSVFQYAFDMIKMGSGEMTKNAQVIAPVSGVTEVYYAGDGLGMGVKIWTGGGYRLGYAVELDHLGNVFVGNNVQVTKGQAIAQVVNYPVGGIPHLHIQVIAPSGVNTTPLNTGVFNFPDGGNSLNCPVISGFQTLGQYCGATLMNAYNNYFADVTGDGKADAIVVNDDKITVRPAASTQNLFLGNQSWTQNAYYGNLGGYYPDQNYKYLGTYFADVGGKDSDGLRKADVIAINYYSGTDIVDVTVRYSTGTNFEANAYTTRIYGATTTDTYAFADFNGDERDDLIVVRNDGIYVGFSQGKYTQFTSLSKRSNEGFYSLADKQGLTFFANVNGQDADGKYRADAIVVNNDKVYIKLNDGAQFGPTYAGTSVAAKGSVKTLVGDINNDNKADLIMVNSNNIIVKYGQSVGYFTSGDWTLSSTAFYGDPGTYLADVDGDKKADIIASNDSIFGHSIAIRRVTGALTVTSLLPTELWTSNAYLGVR